MKDTSSVVRILEIEKLGQKRNQLQMSLSGILNSKFKNLSIKVKFNFLFPGINIRKQHQKNKELQYMKFYDNVIFVFRGH